MGIKNTAFMLACAVLGLGNISCATKSTMAKLGDFQFNVGQYGQSNIGTHVESGNSASSGTMASTVEAVRDGQGQAGAYQSVKYNPDARKLIPKEFVVRTTAYTHNESDHLEYGRQNAAGSNLKYGSQKSAAADWSRFPLGTRFKIAGLPGEYIVDDYGRALTGTNTIDLYKPDFSSMRAWGTRNVGIEVIEWGSFEASRRILDDRKAKPDADHVRRMLHDIESKMDRIPPELRNGFAA